MKKIIYGIAVLLAAGCASGPRYSFTVYESGNLVSSATVNNSLENTMIVVRDNTTGDWVTIPGTAVSKRLYPNRVGSTQPSN